MSWPSEPAPGPIEPAGRAAAAACVRLSGLFRRVGLDSSWRFRSEGGRVFGLALARLDGGGIQAEVGFDVEDLAIALEDDAALNELALQAIGQWRQRSIAPPSSG